MILTALKTPSRSLHVRDLLIFSALRCFAFMIFDNWNGLTKQNTFAVIQRVIMIKIMVDVLFA